jgi:hypothetical protein
MILATHALVGAAIGKTLDTPLVIIPLALIVHFILDSFIHGEYTIDSKTEGMKKVALKISLDLITGFTTILFLISLDFFALNLSNIFIGVFFSLFPDLLTLIHKKFPDNKILSGIKSLHEYAHRYHRHGKDSASRQWNFRNARNDIIFSLAAILIFLFL